MSDGRLLCEVWKVDLLVLAALKLGLDSEVLEHGKGRDFTDHVMILFWVVIREKYGQREEATTRAQSWVLFTHFTGHHVQIET